MLGLQQIIKGWGGGAEQDEAGTPSATLPWGLDGQRGQRLAVGKRKPSPVLDEEALGWEVASGYLPRRGR